MATSMPNPQAAQPSPDQGQGGADSQANPLKSMLGMIVVRLRQIGQSNTLIQPQLNQAASLVIEAIQEASKAAPGPPQPLQSPPQG